MELIQSISYATGLAMLEEGGKGDSCSINSYIFVSYIKDNL